MSIFKKIIKTVLMALIPVVCFCIGLYGLMQYNANQVTSSESTLLEQIEETNLYYDTECKIVYIKEAGMKTGCMCQYISTDGLLCTYDGTNLVEFSTGKFITPYTVEFMYADADRVYDSVSKVLYYCNNTKASSYLSVYYTEEGNPGRIQLSTDSTSTEE